MGVSTKLLLLFILHQVTSSAVKIVDYINNTGPQDYHFRYATSDFQEREESGIIVSQDNQQVLRVSGRYSYLDPNSNKYIVFYTADENGYKATLEFEGSAEKPITTTPENNIIETIAFPPLVGIGANVLATLAGGGLGR